MDRRNALTPLEASAAAAHEVYLALKGAGFTETQAVKVVIGLIAAKTGPTEED